ncbi:MAG: sulfotransferase, partial [Pseudomonadota bacterium]
MTTVPMTEFRACGPTHRPLVNVIGIGAQKCASSWIHSVLGTHPEVEVGEPKEIDFFSYYFDRGYRWYERHFAGGDEKAIRFESSPSYFYDPRTPGRVRDYNRDMRVLLLLRDPVARAFSNHMHEIIKGHIPVVPFETGLPNNPAYLEQGMYATHLTRWREAFGPDAVRVMFAEEVSADAEGQAKALFRHLNIDDRFESAILSEKRNDSDRARMPALRTGLRAGGDWMRRQGLEPVLAKVKATPPVAQILSANRIAIRDEIPPMQTETKTHLRAIFAPEMDRLREMLRRPLPWDAAP